MEQAGLRRRGFLAQTLGTVFTGATFLEQAFFRAAQARAQAATAPSTLFDIEKIAGEIWAAVARPATFINSNAAIFELGDGLLVVDSHSKPSAAAALAAQFRKEASPKPIRYLVNSHFHWDHTQGTAGYRRAAPAAQVISSTATRSLIAEFGAARLTASLEQLPKAIDEYARQIAAAKTPEQKARLERRLADTRAYLAEMKGYTPELPAITFDHELVLHTPQRELRLVFRGRGHTAGDVMVYAPREKVIATGDLAHGFLPYIGDGYPREWPRTLRAAGEFEFAHLVGGHGAVQHSRQRLDQMAAYIEELTGAVAKGKAEGRSAAELQQAITPASLKSLTGGYGDFVAASLIRFDADSATSNAAEVLASGVRNNVADIYRTLERT